MKKLLYACLGCISCLSTLSAQIDYRYNNEKDSDAVQNEIMPLLYDWSGEQVSPPTLIPSSPQSQIFEKYAKYQEPSSRGVAEITIPLYEIELKGVKIPIILSYDTKGIRYKQYDGEVGAGWSLSIGSFRVTRNIYGEPDEEYALFNKTQLDSYLQQSGYFRDSYMASIGSDCPGCLGFSEFSKTDGEYDQFTYVLPSTNGHFIINNRTSRTVDISESNPDKFTYTEETVSGAKSISTWTVKDQYGNQYELGKQSYETLYGKSNTGKATAWPLKRIKTSANETVDFTYSLRTVNTTRNRQYNLQLTEAPKVMMPYHYSVNYLFKGNVRDVYYYTEEVLLDKIVTDKEIITIQRSSDPNLSERIQTITIQSKTNSDVYKTIRFNYKISPSTANLAENKMTPWHCLLSSVQVGNGSTFIQKYDFSYTEPSTPDRLFPDQWGFYKMSSTTFTGVRDLQLFNEFGDDQILYSSNSDEIDREQYRKLSLSMTASTVGLPYYFLSRSGNADAVSYYSLNKMTYPTGGTTEYTYEPNQYKSGSTVVKGSGYRIRKITSRANTDSESVVTEYRYGAGEDGNGYVADPRVNYRDYYTTLALSLLTYDDPYYPGKGFHGKQIIRTYSNKPLLEDFEEAVQVSYGQVAAYQYSGSDASYNGKTIYNYSVFNAADISEFQNTNVDSYRWFVNRYRKGRSPLLTSKEIYKNTTLQMKEEYTYTTTGERTFQGVKIYQDAFFDNYEATSSDPNPSHAGNPYSQVRSLFSYGYYTLEQGYQVPASKKTTIYDGSTLTTTEGYTYNTNKLVKTQTRQNSTGGSQSLSITYPSDYADGVSSSMVGRNMLAYPVEKKWTTGSTVTSVSKTTYGSYNGTLYLPSVVQSSAGGSSLHTDLTFDAYDSYGNILQYTRSDGTKVSYIWSYNYQYPIAEIENAGLSDIYTYISQSTLNSLAAKSIPVEADWTPLSDLKTKLKAARITLYKYKPLFGITEMTDPTGLTTNYVYDNYGRLIGSSYKDGSSTYTIESYNYNNINK